MDLAFYQALPIIYRKCIVHFKYSLYFLGQPDVHIASKLSARKSNHIHYSWVSQSNNKAGFYWLKRIKLLKVFLTFWHIHCTKQTKEHGYKKGQSVLERSSLFAFQNPNCILKMMFSSFHKQFMRKNWFNCFFDDNTANSKL